MRRRDQLRGGAHRFRPALQQESRAGAHRAGHHRPRWCVLQLSRTSCSRVSGSSRGMHMLQVSTCLQAPPAACLRCCSLSGTACALHMPLNAVQEHTPEPQVMHRCAGAVHDPASQQPARGFRGRLRPGGGLCRAPGCRLPHHRAGGERRMSRLHAGGLCQPASCWKCKRASQTRSIR